MLLTSFRKLRLYKKVALLAAVLVLAVALFRDSAWGINHLYYLDRPITLFLVAIGAVLLYMGFSKNDRKHSKSDSQPEEVISVWQLFILPVVAAALCLLLPIVTDVYGDAHSIVKNYESFYQKERSISDALWVLFDPDIFNLHNGERFTFNFIFILRKVFGMDLDEAFRLYGAFFCFGMALVYNLYLKTARLGFNPAYVLFFISLNSMVVFAGHHEVYAPSIFFLTLFLLLAKRQYERNRRGALIWLAIVLFFAIKSHFINFVLLAPYAFLVVLKLRPSFVNFLTFRNTMVLALSSILGFSLAYFFIFKNHNSHYGIRGDELFGNIFLPLVAPEAPFDNYSMFNINHLYDFIQLCLSWSPLLWLVLSIRLFKKDLFKSVSNFYLLALLVLLTYAFVSFVFNPLLSMPRDWDILSVGAPALLILGTEIWAVMVKRVRYKLLLCLTALFVFFTLPRVLVESQRDWSGKRLLMVGDHVYKTYYANSSLIISKAVKQMQNVDSESLIRLSDEWIEDSNVKPDTELGHALAQIGIYYAENRRKNLVALKFYNKALYVYPDYALTMRAMATALLNTENYLEALDLAQQLLRMDDSNQQHWHLALNSLAALDMNEELLDASSQYLERFPEDENRINSILSSRGLR